MNATTTRGALLAALACVLVGGSFTANSVLGHYPYAGGQFLRYGLACLLLLPLVGRGGTAPLRCLTSRQWVRLAALAAVGMVGFNLSVIAAERSAEPAVPGVFVGCAPVVVAVVMPLVEGRRPQRLVLCGASLVAVGAFTVQGWGRADGAGIAFSLSALAGEVGFAVLAVPVLRPLGPRLLSAVVCAMAAAESAAVGLVVDGTAWLRTPDRTEAAALLWQAAVVTVVGFVCWYMGMQRIGAERATLFSGLIPVAAACTAPLVGTGSYGAVQAAGSGLVGAGVALGSGALRRGAGRSATAVQDDPRDQRRIVVHRDVPATGQPHQPGPGDDLLRPHPLAADQEPVLGTPRHGDRHGGDVVRELDGGARLEGLGERRGVGQGERLGDDRLG
ncbi:putative integral membrane protein [Streptomyces avermitilis MA-4680 = NBRC 14893]|uniref:Integral membrane protein n=1 Tax=Streptomyces avermitilis (strain ATCC 31267 / DSM 46492 / JCM 5070 / NBRC 14893 / NCIMB 12804 / NRRL 8165 / MA-4680) TaxID=227882 RepID=Q826V9_STRAW|nr:putative integral membrane protein [Streptomyces avermitilis MA-4680 = NBRC 14893]